MKSLMLLFSIFMLFSCKKQEEVKVNKLIAGLDPSVSLPKSDTTNAFAYFQGYIDGEYFSIVQDNDSFNLYDFASTRFGVDYNKDWFSAFPDGGSIIPAWYFDQPIQREKKWSIRFELPAYSSLKGEKEYINFKRKYTTPAVFTNIGERQAPTNLEVFDLSIFRRDIFNGQPNTFGLATFTGNLAETNTLQKDSYIKLVSVRYVDYIPNSNYHYEMIYEFDLKLKSGANILHLTKGRMKTWLVKIKL